MPHLTATGHRLIQALPRWTQADMDAARNEYVEYDDGRRVRLADMTSADLRQYAAEERRAIDRDVIGDHGPPEAA